MLFQESKAATPDTRRVETVHWDLFGSFWSWLWKSNQPRTSDIPELLSFHVRISIRNLHHAARGISMFRLWHFKIRTKRTIRLLWQPTIVIIIIDRYWISSSDFLSWLFWSLAFVFWHLELGNCRCIFIFDASDTGHFPLGNQMAVLRQPIFASCRQVDVELNTRDL